MGADMKREGGELESDGLMGTGPVPIHEIMSMIKHRYPLLLIDHVDECVPGTFISGRKNVSRGETTTVNRWSGMPRLLIVEALAQISVILTFKTLGLRPTGTELMFFAGIDNGRFYGRVEPGDVIVLRSEVVRLRKAMGWFKASAHTRGCCVATMSMLAAIQLG
jgi:3-hydroxyacyl-[acyl-carrier-protein] dehydratase